MDNRQEQEQEEQQYINEILFINDLNDFNLNILIIKETINQILNNNNNNNNNNLKIKLYLILINSNLKSIESIGNSLSKYYSFINKFIINFSLYIDCIILIPELYKQQQEQEQIQVDNNNNSILLLNSIKLIFEKLNNLINNIYLSIIDNILIELFNSIGGSDSDGFKYTVIRIPLNDSSGSNGSSNTLDFNYKLINNLKKYNRVYCGGFFDYLHSGHKTFLSIGSLISNEKYFISVLQKSSIVLSGPSTPVSSPIKCNNSISNSNNEDYDDDDDEVMCDDITPPSSPTKATISNNLFLRSHTSPSILQKQGSSGINGKLLQQQQCPYDHDGFNNIKSSKSSIGEIKNINFDYFDKNNDKLMQPIEIRMQQVLEFLNQFNPFHKSIEVVTNTRCSDINYCPMTFIDQIDAIIITDTNSNKSNNTHKINLIREKRNLKQISIHSIPQVECFQSNNKISSSYIRSLLNK